MAKMAHFKQRLAVSSILIALLFVLVYFSTYAAFKPIFALVVSAVIALSLYEYYCIAEIKGFSPLIFIGLVSSIAYTLAVFLENTYTHTISFAPLIFGISLLVSFIYFFFFTMDSPLIKLAVTFFGFIYIAIPMSLMISINYFFSESDVQDGRWWLLYVLAVTKITDAGAYFSGKLFGYHSLATHISPKKTIEGSIGGLIFAIIASLALPHIASAISHPKVLQISFIESIYLGSAIGILAQIGDLAESLLKRDAGIKDSNILPGLGGMLDLIDSLLFTIPLVYFYLHIYE